LARRGRFPVAAIVTLVAAAAARATNGLETDAATSLSVGAAPHPGFVVVDPYASDGRPPVLATVAAPAPFGAAPAGPPAFDAGPGGSNFTFFGSATVPGGTYDCAVFSVAKNVVVTFTGPTTIRAATRVTLQGAVRTLGDDQPLTILTNGDIQVFNANNFGAAVATAGARSDLTLRSGAWFLASGGQQPISVAASKSSLFVSAWTANVAPNGLVAGVDLEIVCGSDVTMFGPVDSVSQNPEGGVVAAAGRDATIRSALSDVVVSGAELHVAGRLAVEAGRNVSFDDEAVRVSADGGMDVSAPGGRIDVTGGAIVTAGKAGAVGASTWRARDGVFVTGRSTYSFPAWSTCVSCGSSKFVVESTAGDVDLGMDGTPSPPHAIGADGSIEIRAAGTARIRGTARVTAKSGATLAALAAVSLDAGASIDAGTGAFVAESPSIVTIGGSGLGGSVSLWSPTSVTVASGANVEATLNDLVVTAHDVTFDGIGTAYGAVRISTLGGVADVRGATLSTRDATSGASGVVQVVAYPGPNATIRAQGATLRSGASSTTSGDVVLRVIVPSTGGTFPPGGGGTTPATTRGDPPFVVPASVVAKSRRRSTAQDLTLRGRVDFGTSAPLASGAATVSIGGVDLAATLVVAKNGAATARGADVVVSLGRPRAGSPRRTVTLRARGAFLPDDLSGDLRVRLALGGVEAACRVRLERGRFDARRGALVEPFLHVAGVKSLPRGFVRVTFGLPSNAMATSEAPSVVLELAGTRWYFERTQLLLDRGRFAAKSPADGVARVSVDPFARTIDVDVDAASIGLGSTGGPLEIALRVDGGATRLLRVVVAAVRGKLAY